ncbi:MAG: hypothetical protein WBZ36_10215 [Candidatus Nitrosopolaris sp.]
MSADYISKLIKTMLKIPDSYEFQPQSQTSQDMAMEAVFKMRNKIINAIAKKRF